MNDSQLIHGDCLKELPKIPDRSIDCVISDPPYSQDHNKHWDRIIPFEPLWKELKRIIKDEGAILLTGQQPFTADLVNSNKTWFRYELIWDKHIPRGRHQAKVQPMRKHENIIVFSKHAKHNYYPRTFRGDKNPTSIITGCWEPTRGYGRYHPTQKPVALMEYLMKCYTKENDTVLDFCGGSFSTGIAAINTNRKFIGIEKNLLFFTVGAKRLRDHPSNPD